VKRELDGWKRLRVTKDAYGNPLNFNPATALTTLLYSGEQFDQQIAMQYLRARYYNPATGTFNRLDPFAGNMQDPQSLHKYLYAHGDPIHGIDPTGLATLKVTMAALAVGVSFAATTGYVFHKAERSVSYGIITGVVGGAALFAAITMRWPLKDVLTEATLSLFFATAATALLDWRLGRLKSNWYYASVGLEAFAWSAHGAMWLNPKTQVKISGGQYGSPDAPQPWELKESGCALSLIGQTALQLISAGVATIMDAAYWKLVSFNQGGLTRAQKTLLKSQVKDNVGTMAEAFLGAIPNAAIAWSTADWKGIRYLPPTLKGKITRDIIEIAFGPALEGELEAFGNWFGDMIADAVVDDLLREA
jgi:RHS repeat-associated protein